VSAPCEEALSRLTLFGESSLRHALKQYDAHYHTEGPHQGLGYVVLLPAVSDSQRRDGPVRCQERLGELLKYYDGDAA
jgi:hypothetical protein